MKRRSVVAALSALVFIGFAMASSLKPVSAQDSGLPTWVDVPCGSNYQTALDWAFHKNLMVGAPSGVGRAGSPTRPLSRAEAVVILHRLAGSPAPVGTHTFTDMGEPGLGFAQTAVSWAVNAGVVKGRTPTMFAPTENISRAAFVTLLHRMAGSPAPASAVSFPDMGDADLQWAQPQVSWAAAAGISQGSFGLFKPRDNVNRAETAIFMRRFAPTLSVDQAVPARPSPTDGCVSAPPPSTAGTTTSTTAKPPCHPAYDPCLVNLDGDALNCADLTSAQKPVTVRNPGVDPYNLDSDGDGTGCTS